LLDVGRRERGDWFDEKEETDSTRKTRLLRERRKRNRYAVRASTYTHARAPCQTLARLHCLSPSVPAHLPCRKQHSLSPPSQWLRVFGVRRRRAWNHTTTVLTRHDGRRSTLRQWDDAVGARRWPLRSWETTLFGGDAGDWILGTDGCVKACRRGEMRWARRADE
jgi:hypothetical protein